MTGQARLIAAKRLEHLEDARCRLVEADADLCEASNIDHEGLADVFSALYDALEKLQVQICRDREVVKS